jgi:hypothetical protein
LRSHRSSGRVHRRGLLALETHASDPDHQGRDGSGLLALGQWQRLGGAQAGRPRLDLFSSDTAPSSTSARACLTTQPRERSSCPASAVDADRVLTHAADRLLTRGWAPTV